MHCHLYLGFLNESLWFGPVVETNHSGLCYSVQVKLSGNQSSGFSWDGAESLPGFESPVVSSHSIPVQVEASGSGPRVPSRIPFISWNREPDGSGRFN